MFLADCDIQKAYQEGKIKITPTPDWEKQLGACSIDFCLGDTFRVFNYSRHAFIDPREDYPEGDLMSEVKVAEGKPFIMHPQDFVLAVTKESFEISDNLVGLLQGRSSLGRLGIIIHSTAAVFNPGWQGKVTMEIGNLGRMPVALYPGMRICAMMFGELRSCAMKPYNTDQRSKYANQQSPLASRISKEWKK